MPACVQGIFFSWFIVAEREHKNEEEAEAEGQLYQESGSEQHTHASTVHR